MKFNLISWKKKYVLLSWIFMLGLMLLLVSCGPYSAITWLTASREEIYVFVPDGYEGKVLIGWQVPDGEMADQEDDIWVYRLGDDGVLLLQDDPPQEIIRWKFWYEMPDGTRVNIPQSTCFDSAIEEGIVVCQGMHTVIHNGHELRPNLGFTITTVADYRDRK